MSIIIRTPQSNTSPSAGGHAFDSHNNNGGSEADAINSANGAPAQNTSSSCRWFNFAAIGGIITSIRVKFDWSIVVTCDTSVTSDGSANATYNITIDAPGPGINASGGASSSGPGPTNDSDPFNNSGSYNQVIAPADVTTLDIEITITASCDSGLVGSDGNASVGINVSISNIQLEVTLQDSSVVSIW